MRNIKYIGTKATEDAFFDRTQIIWTPGKIDTVLDEAVATEMLRFAEFEDAGDSFAVNSGAMSLDPTAGLLLGGSAPNEQQRAAVRAGMYGDYRSNTLKKGPWGRFQVTANTNNKTDAYQMELEAPFFAVRLWLPNIHTAELAGIKANAYAQTTLGAVTGNAGAILDDAGGGTNMVAFTWAGVSSVTLPVRVAAERPSWTVSDWAYVPSLARADGGTRPLLGMRIEKPSTTTSMTTTVAAVAGWDSASEYNDGRILRKYSANQLGVTNWANWSTAPVASQTSGFWPFILEYALADASGVQWLGAGDSTVEGYGSTASLNAHWMRACRRRSTPEAPMDYVNAGLHAQSLTTYTEYLSEIFPQVNPDVLVFAPYTINSVSTAYGQVGYRASRGSAGRAMALAGKKASVILLAGLPCNAAFKSYTGDALRRSLNTVLVDVPGSRVAVADIATPVSGAVDGSDQTQLADGMTADNVHLSETAQELTYAVVDSACDRLAIPS